MTKPTIFKKYDIRGAYPEELNSTSAKKIVLAFLSIFSPTEVVIGHDAVEGANVVGDVIAKEFSSKNIKVTKIGTVTTPRLLFASNQLNIQYGFMITASHLGVGFTGVKFLINGMPPTAEQINQMAMQYAQIENEELTTGNDTLTSNTDINTDYINKIKELTGIYLNKYKIVIDNGNGPNGNIIDDVLDQLHINAIVINKEINGINPAHSTNPKEESARKQLVEKIKSENADFGIIWDGDGDRGYFVDNNGLVIPPEFVGIVISKYFMSKKLMTTMTVDVRASRAMEEMLSETGCIVKRIQAWNIPIKEEMAKDPNIGFGIETSGHYVFRDFYRIDDGLLASLLFVKALEENKTDFRTLLKKFRDKYYIVEEINFETQKSEKEIIETLKTSYSDAQIDLTDGISIDYPTWRFNARASKSEPLIRLNISGTDKTKVETELQKLTQIIKK